MIGSLDDGEEVTLIATLEHVFSGTDTDPQTPKLLHGWKA